MVRKKKEKTVVCWAIALMGLLMVAGVDPGVVGVCRGCEYWRCAAWMWVHGGWVHWVMNVWVLLGVAFKWECGWKVWGWSVAIAVAWGLMCREGVELAGASDEAVVGMSGVLYALFGVEALRCEGWRGRLMMNGAVVMSLAMGVVVSAMGGGVAWECHLWCWVMGCVVCLFNFKF